MNAPLVRLAVALSLTLCTALLGGCNESKLTKANFNQIKPGMTQREVELILGPGTVQAAAEGTSISGAGVGSTGTRGATPKVVEWKEGRTRITVTFQNDKVQDTIQENLKD